MSIGSNFWHWCRIPPDPPKNGHKKLLAGSLICTILSVSIIASLVPFYGGLMAGQGNALAASSGILSVANLAEGPYYMQNVTYQAMADANNSTVQNYDGTMQLIQDNETNILSFGGGSCYSSDDSGYMNSTVINFGDQALTVTSIEIYQGNTLFAVVYGPFIVKAHTVGSVLFHVYNLTDLSKWEGQQLTQIGGKQGDGNETTCNWPYDWRPVTYTAMMKTSDGDTITFDHLVFPTAPDPAYLLDSDGHFKGWPIKG
jgi:hypothetical protein